MNSHSSSVSCIRVTQDDLASPGETLLTADGLRGLEWPRSGALAARGNGEPGPGVYPERLRAAVRGRDLAVPRPAGNGGRYRRSSAPGPLCTTASGSGVTRAFSRPAGGPDRGRSEARRGRPVPGQYRLHHRALTTAPPECTWAKTSSLLWRRPRPRRRRPGQRGRLRRTKRAGSRSSPRAGRATTHPAPTRTPPEGRPPGTLQGRADQQGPPRRRPRVPPAGVRTDRRPGRGQPAVRPRAGEDTVPRSRRPPPRTRPDAVAAYKAYSSRGNRTHLRKRRIKAVIPEKKDQAANRKKKNGSGGGRPVRHGASLYKERNTVERLINRLKARRAIATRPQPPGTEHLAGGHQGAVHRDGVAIQCGQPHVVTDQLSQLLLVGLALTVQAGRLALRPPTP